MKERYSMRVILEQKFGETEKNVKTSRSTNRATKKAGDSGKYITKIVDGVKYMALK